jgi:2,3-bisphosphoglycerate-independent phosphoglycerate mutase
MFNCRGFFPGETMNSQKKVPTVLMILDGWGVSTGKGKDAIAGASTPRWDDLVSNFPATILGAAGRDVGLPHGQIGNSEVGHLNLGAGRVVYQDLTRINLDIESGDFDRNPVFEKAVTHVREGSGRLHVMGLISDGGVHSHIEHIKAVCALADRKGVSEILVHSFMDGRDTPPRSGLDYVREMEQFLAGLDNARMATVSGRFWAMDRDNRWDRVARAYDAMVLGKGEKAVSGVDAVQSGYDRDESDEFIVPTVITPEGDAAAGCMADGDGVIFMNFRGDRAREISHALNDPAFDSFPRERMPVFSCYVCLAEYDETFPYPVAYPPQQLTNILGEVVADAGLSQFRIAETEKYAHVTFFFNGGEEKTFTGEERFLVPSPKEVATYDLKPQMSAAAVTGELVSRIGSGKFDLVLVNYANPDMVGHTGIYEAAVKAIETVDSCIGQVADKVLEMGGTMLITSDHGNAESMEDADGTAHTAHTTREVPLVMVGPGLGPDNPPLKKGILADVAPTILKIMGIEQPSEMTGTPLF